MSPASRKFISNPTFTPALLWLSNDSAVLGTIFPVHYANPFAFTLCNDENQEKTGIVQLCGFQEVPEHMESCLKLALFDLYAILNINELSF